MRNEWENADQRVPFQKLILLFCSLLCPSIFIDFYLDHLPVLLHFSSLHFALRLLQSPIRSLARLPVWGLGATEFYLKNPTPMQGAAQATGFFLIVGVLYSVTTLRKKTTMRVTVYTKHRLTLQYH
jgi:hypothetical protein